MIARQRIHSLDGLRGVLALFVCIYHLTNSFPEFKQTLRGWTALLDQGWVAVDVFFVLSGFVMCYVYEKDFRDGVNWPKWLNFMLARVARLYPVHLATFAILFLFLIPFIYNTPRFLDDAGRYSWSSAIASIFMLQGPWVDHRTWNYPSWSISVEWHLYVLFPFMLVLIRNRMACFGVVLGGTILVLIVYLTGFGAEAVVTGGDWEPYPTNGPVALLRGLLLFSAGIAVYGIRDIAGPALNIVALPVVFGFVGLLLFEPTAPFSVLLVPVLILCVMTNPLVSDGLSGRIQLFLGKISYSLYMTHALVQIIFVNRVKDYLQAGGGVPSDLAITVVILAGVALSIVFGYLMYRYVELGGRQFVRRLIDRSALASA
ncbi:acyltransferase [Kaistia dalseonensis]|uniref:Peptidoglycan/LPS O-acetylase OafA/YrhL n=1 Tax=Kaistia dalseonensis TaxID=410840 RepID=A0ABU0H202_9HYPH|nr:acyltransferase [Kaistia dalseonensis]MCX5493778.1 acyltransferase [Kaistia dalseonensis]MDQ0436342.1 peptidoglycan/LPS O-acetylase OafA/YrhL [Kaistia dalseonensis]